MRRADRAWRWRHVGDVHRGLGGLEERLPADAAGDVAGCRVLGVAERQLAPVFLGRQTAVDVRPSAETWRASYPSGCARASARPLRPGKASVVTGRQKSSRVRGSAYVAHFAKALGRDFDDEAIGNLATEQMLVSTSAQESGLSGSGLEKAREHGAGRICGSPEL